MPRGRVSPRSGLEGMANVLGLGEPAAAIHKRRVGGVDDDFVEEAGLCGGGHLPRGRTAAEAAAAFISSAVYGAPSEPLTNVEHYLPHKMAHILRSVSSAPGTAKHVCGARGTHNIVEPRCFSKSY